MHRKLEGIWREDVRQFVGLLGAELKRYRSSYERDFRGRWRPASPGDLLAAVERADLVFSGDYHTLPAAQRLPIRLLRPFVRQGRKITLALEMLHSQDQPIIDDYLARRIGARRLRRQIAFDRRWGFDWMQYHALLDFARRERIGVIGINSDPGRVRHRLARRDRHAAMILARHLLSHPGELLFVLAGDWHVARNHLPRQTLRLARSDGFSPRTVVIHQNHEGLYRRFQADAAGIPDIVRRRRDLYCVLNTAPHVKAQSHLRWAVDACHTAAPRDSVPEDWLLHDPAADFWEILTALAGLLDVPVDLNLTVHGGDDPGVLNQAARAAGAAAARRRAWSKKLENGGTVYIPATRTVLLGRARLNQVAAEAGRRLRPAGGGPARFTRRSNFFDMALDNGAAFFASRLINPLRKCDLVDDLLGRGSGTLRQRYEAAWARFFTTGGEADAILRPAHPLWRTPARLRQEVARTVGAIWGYYLYDSYISGRIAPEWVSALFRGGIEQGSEELFMEGACLESPGRRISSKRALL